MNTPVATRIWLLQRNYERNMQYEDSEIFVCYEDPGIINICYNLISRLLDYKVYHCNSDDAKVLITSINYISYFMSDVASPN